MYILGINAYHGDAAAAIVRDGELIAAVEEERFNRIKHCAGFPTQSIQYCLRAAGIGIEDVDHVGISRDPSAHLHKKVLLAARRASAQFASRKRAMPTVAFASAENALPTSALGASGASIEADASLTEAAAAGLATQRNGNGAKGDGLARQVTERLRNAAKVRDLKNELARELKISKSSIRARFHNIEHHRAHLASAFFVSPFEHAALLSLDGFGDFISTMWGVGEGNSIRILGQIEYPHSLGIVYTATTQFLGFPHYGDEGKVMGLAPYGRPRFIEEFRDIVRSERKGRFSLNLNYFRHSAEGVDMTWKDGSPEIGRIFSDEYARKFGSPRQAGAQVTDRECDLAASLQMRLEEVAFHILNNLHHETGLETLGLAGGVAYNSVMNGKILLHTPFRRIFIQPAAGDSGTALGVCYQILSETEKSKAQSDKSEGESDKSQAQSGKGQGESDRSEGESGKSEGQSDKGKAQSDKSQGQSARGKAPVASSPAPLLFALSPLPFTGPDFSDDRIGSELESLNLTGDLSDTSFQRHSAAEITKRAARDIAAGLVVGWFQGRMEFGPRALGNRSILVDPRRHEMKDILNQRIKKREPFRPFAPAILEEQAGEYFEQTHPSPAMLMVYQIRPERRKEIPAVTHVDGSGRLQTVSREVNARFYELIEEFYKLSGVPVVLNTSFNENEPIVCSPRDAIECFLKTRMDVLYIGNYIVRKNRAARET